MSYDSVFDMDFDPIDHVQEMEDWLDDPEFDQLESDYHDSLYGA